MGLDYRTIAMYGWKVEDVDKLEEMENDLEDWNEDYYDDLDDFLVEDTMMGRYIYFGVKLVYFDPTDDNQEEIIDEKLVSDAASKWNKYLKDNPEFEKIVNKYKNGEPKLYVFSHIW